MKNLFYFLGFLIILSGVSFILSPVFAEQEEIGVSIPAGTDTPGCEETDLCYIPSPLTVTVGTVVEWTNQDSAPHTVTSGSPQKGPDGIIYSDLMTAGEVFAFQFDEPGSFPYFCMIHPWMEGLVIVEVSAESQSESDDFALTEQMVSADGSTIVTIQTDIPKAGNELDLELQFTDENNNLLAKMNYDLRIIQDGEDVLLLENAHSQDGSAEHRTQALESDNPVDVEIGIRGIYPTSEKSQPIEEVIKFQQIPEFGQIVFLVLVLSISALVVLGVKPIFKIPNQ